MKRNNDNSVIVHALLGNANVIDINVKDFSWYVPHFTPNIAQQTLLSKHIFSRVPTELSYIDRSVGVKRLDAQSNWFFALGVKGGIDVPRNVIIGSKIEME